MPAVSSAQSNVVWVQISSSHIDSSFTLRYITSWRIQKVPRLNHSIDFPVSVNSNSVFNFKYRNMGWPDSVTEPPYRISTYVYLSFRDDQRWLPLVSKEARLQLIRSLQGMDIVGDLKYSRGDFHPSRGLSFTTIQFGFLRLQNRLRSESNSFGYQSIALKLSLQALV